MFVLSKWQRVALPTRWRASVRPLLYCYHTFLDHTTNINRKLLAPRHVSASGAPKNAQKCHLDETRMDKTTQHQKNWKNSTNDLSFYDGTGTINNKLFLDQLTSSFLNNFWSLKKKSKGKHIFNREKVYKKIKEASINILKL